MMQNIRLLNACGARRLSVDDKSTEIHRIMEILGAQWLNGRVLNSRPRGHGFEPQRRHCVVSLFN